MRRLRKLARARQVRDFSIAEFDQLEQSMTLLDAPAGACLVREGDPAAAGPSEPALFIVVEGVVEVFRGSADQRAFTIELEAGSLIGVLALFADGVRSATCVALTDVTLATLTRPQFESLLAARTVVGLKFQKWVARQLVTDARRLDDSLLARARALSGVVGA